MGAPRKKRKEYYPFYVDYDSNRSAPGHFEIVRVYFKPRKTVGIERKKKTICKFFGKQFPFHRKSLSFHSAI